ncbi:helix-turn-helix domain-containing protein [Vibrio rotiferianus]
MDANKIAQLGQVPAYITGQKFIDRLLKKLGLKDIEELHKMVNVPKASLQAWIDHDRTSHELVIRIHLVTGIPVQELIMDDVIEGEATEVPKSKLLN